MSRQRRSGRRAEQTDSPMAEDVFRTSSPFSGLASPFSTRPLTPRDSSSYRTNPGGVSESLTLTAKSQASYSPQGRGSPVLTRSGSGSPRGRRRVRSINVSNGFVSSHPVPPRTFSMDGSENVVSGTLYSSTGIKGYKGKGKALMSDQVGDDFAASDEYDLAHEDNKILLDVERALKFKARREARLKAGQSIASPPRRGILQELSSEPSSSVSPSPARPSSTRSERRVPYITRSRATTESEIDFSPSKPMQGTSKQHPVPISSDGGKTLSWTVALPEVEKLDKRWHLPKRKAKEKEVPPSVAVLEDMQARHSRKLAGIRAKTSSQTLRKAKITFDQLDNRYKLLSRSMEPDAEGLNLAKVFRWFRSLDPEIKLALEKAESPAWLRHLEKPGTDASNRAPFHLSALIVEEYIRAQSNHIEPVPEGNSSGGSSPLNSLLSRTRAPAPSMTLASMVSSQFSLGPSLSRRRSYEGIISFEPLRENGQSSPGAISDSQMKSWKHFPFTPVESPRSSVYGGAYNSPSPSSSRLQIRDNGLFDYSPKLGGSFEVLPSTLDSLPELSGKPTRRLQKPEIPWLSPSPSLSPEKRPEKETGSDAHTSIQGTGLGIIPNKPSQGQCRKVPSSKPQVSGTASDGETRMPKKFAKSEQDPLDHRVVQRRRPRVLSSSEKDDKAKAIEDKRRESQEEERESYEYELKAQLLDSSIAQNQRIRQLLNRIAIGVREFEDLQSNLAKSLGRSPKNLPKELLGAFSLDPAAVTGSTRKLRGWRAVEDIYTRLEGQRETFRKFLAQTGVDGLSSQSESALQGPISLLGEALAKLEVHRMEAAKKAQDVTQILTKVKSIHGVVKTLYNETVGHTSVVYPELSYIVALEESYKDWYQHIWDIGLEALTILLDSITPFWRTYGKRIGEDVQDFLIIPLYRNEFTGEARRYPIKSFPNRSLRHWAALLLVFLSAISVNILQARAAMTSTLNCRLLWIPHKGLRWFLVPFFAVGIVIQWIAVFVEFFIVACQVGVVAWWFGWMIRICR